MKESVQITPKSTLTPQRIMVSKGSLMTDVMTHFLISVGTISSDLGWFFPFFETLPSGRKPAPGNF